jgi:type IV pilus assembly protein PilX
MRNHRIHSVGTRSRQRGAALFVGLMVLILLALLGLSGMQAASLQERMAGNYRTSNLAFQRGERELRDVEAEMQQVTNANGLVTPTETGECPTVDATGWASRDTAGDAHKSARLTACITGWSVYREGDQGRTPVEVFLILGKDSDRPGSDTSIAMLESIYIP